MLERYRMYRRTGGTYYAKDKVTGKSESLETRDKATAKQLLAARNHAVAQPQLNRTLAKAYLSAKSPRTAHPHLVRCDETLRSHRRRIDSGS